MKASYQSVRHDQLNRKLQLYLGSQKNWMKIYADWCADNDVSDTESHEHHNVQVFVREMKTSAPAKEPTPSLPQRQG